ncbi:hypothetical protein BD779DRAFT_761112 [Infundibulicybe gibba]|nr:hypothetical protein BD779DRAFT_225839 [Infundibulicybe gibba]KAF8884848.1 hypothetical protein BD779DRAFT_761112 [Infundibulicybe gibba]
MGPGQPTMSNLEVPNLEDSGSNWVTYKERVIQTLTHQGLERHLYGTVPKPGASRGRWEVVQQRRTYEIARQKGNQRARNENRYFCATGGNGSRGYLPNSQPIHFPSNIQGKDLRKTLDKTCQPFRG